LVEQHRKDHGIEVTLTVEHPRTPPADVVVALLGAAREALTNAAKHSPGHPIAVHLDGGAGSGPDERPLDGRGPGRASWPGDHGGLRLEVRNDRDLAALPGEKGFGLAGMRERLALVNGTLEAGPDGDAWLVVAEVPDERAGGER
jgi:signal transduction histidine kinase